jgi:hypothetical protein
MELISVGRQDITFSPATTMASTFNASQKRDLLKTFRQKATEMVELQHLTSVIGQGLNTDINIGDCVITTTTYDSSIFKCDKLMKGKKELPNPYTELVVKTPVGHRTPGMSVIAGRGEKNAFEEKRIKVRKVNLLSWDEEKNFYPYSSQPIIFRQKNIEFRKEYERDLNWWRTNQDSIYMTDEMKEEARGNILLLEKLVKIPPFLAYYDDKYGFLVKRDLMPTRIVFPHGISPFASSVKQVAEQVIADQVKQMEATATARVPMTADTFREAVLHEAMKPERIEKLVEKHGIDGAELTFTATDEGRGKA